MINDYLFGKITWNGENNIVDFVESFSLNELS